MQYFYILGTIQALFFATLVISKKQKSSSDIILFVWLLIFSFNLLFPYFGYHGSASIAHYFWGTDLVLFSLHPAFIYLYTISFTHTITRKQLLLFSTPFLFTLVFIFPYFFLPVDHKKKILYFQEQIPWYFIFGIVISLGANFLFIPLAIKKLKEYQNKLKHIVSFNEEINLSWLQLIIYGYLLFITSGVIVAFLFTFSKRPMAEADIFMYAILGILMFGFAFAGIRYGTIHEYETQFMKPNIPKKQPFNNNHEKSKDEEILKKLKKAMIQERLFLNPKLSINELSNAINEPVYLVSQIINQTLSSNFYDFVNTYRVEAIKEELSKETNYSILALAYDCGFNSKATFNRIFKNNTGLTPSEYQRKYMSQTKSLI